MYLWYLRESDGWRCFFVSSKFHGGLMALDPRSFLNYIRGTMWNPIESNYTTIK